MCLCRGTPLPARCQHLPQPLSLALVLPYQCIALGIGLCYSGLDGTQIALKVGSQLPRMLLHERHEVCMPRLLLCLDRPLWHRLWSLVDDHLYALSLLLLLHALPCAPQCLCLAEATTVVQTVASLHDTSPGND